MINGGGQGVPGEVEDKSLSWQLLPQYFSDGQTKCMEGEKTHTGILSLVPFPFHPFSLSLNKSRLSLKEMNTAQREVQRRARTNVHSYHRHFLNETGIQGLMGDSF